MTGKSVPPPALPGVYFDGRTSRDHPATLALGPETAVLHVPALGVSHTWRAAEVSADPAVPGVRRVLKFPDGTRFETADDAAVSAWEARTRRNRAASGVRWLESRWGAAVASLAVAGLVVAAAVVFGIPALAARAAAVTPRGVLTAFDRETLQVLDAGDYVGPSTLSAARQAQLQRGFRDVAAWAGGGYAYTLLLRDGEPEGGSGIGPNAFALPGGTVVLTDQLVAMARNDRELLGVLAHEAGHVTYRHGLAGVYQGLGLTLLTTVLTGDLVSASTFAAAVPAALLRGGYSRAAETQSDEVAGRFMLERYRTTKPLQDLLARLDKERGDGDENGDGQGGFNVFDLLRSHPGTAQRIAHLRALEQAARP